MAAGIKILETFRDSIQGLHYFIPTEKKIYIINRLLEVGFDILDVGSFVSPKIIPQFKDMNEVLDKINYSASPTRLFTLVANKKGAESAKNHEQIHFFGYPFSTSETFLKKNINRDFESVWRTINEIQDICLRSGKELMVYEAMAFGNPYGDPAHVDICLEWAAKFSSIGIKFIHLSDITGVSSPSQIASYYQQLTNNFPSVEFGIHLHVKGENDQEKILAAYENNCTIFDGVISGLGGCPMTGYEMLSNLKTGLLVEFAKNKGLVINPDERIFIQTQTEISSLIGLQE